MLTLVYFFLLSYLSIYSESHKIVSLVDDFKENPNLGDDLSLIVIAKDFIQVERHDIKWLIILDRFEVEHARKAKENPFESLKRFTLGNIPKKIYDDKRGVIFGVSLEGKDEISLFDSKWRRYSRTPNGISFFEDRMLIAGGKYVEEIDFVKQTTRRFSNKWFQSIHTIEYNHDGTKALLTSTGYDTIFEIDLLTKGDIVWEWCAWDHGYEMSTWGLPVTRDLDKSKEYHKNSIVHFYTDPEQPEYRYDGLYKFARPCHVNGAWYENENTISTCFLHRNLTLFINKESNESQIVFSEYTNQPHSFIRHHRDVPCRGGHSLVSTKDGALLFLDDNFEICLEISFRRLPGFKKAMERNNIVRMEWLERRLVEWIQFARYLGVGDLYSVVDTKRGQIVILDMANNEYRLLPYDLDLSVQDVRLEPPQYSEKLKMYTELEKEKKKNVHDESTCTDDDFDDNINNLKKLWMYHEDEVEFVMDFCNSGRYEGKKLKGFMNREDLYCVMEEKTLCDGSIFWDEDNIIQDDDDDNVHFSKLQGSFRPVVKRIDEFDLDRLEIGDVVALLDEKNNDKILATMEVESLYRPETHYMAMHMYGKSVRTFLKHGVEEEVGEDFKYFGHEGIRSIMQLGSKKKGEHTGYLVGGKIKSCHVV